MEIGLHKTTGVCRHSSERMASWLSVWQELAIFVPTAALIVAIMLSLSGQAIAAPETWFNPTQTFTGSSLSSFGSAISCSSEYGGVGPSYFAIGAPSEASGEGRVHIYGLTGRVQTLTAPMPHSPGDFGYAVAFVPDLNDDLIDELAVGEPGGAGIVHIYLSTGSPTEPYVHCGAESHSHGFGSFIYPMTVPGMGQTAHLVVGNPISAEVFQLSVARLGSTCSFSWTNEYSGVGPNGSHTRYGQSMGESYNITSGHLLIVGAPRDGGVDSHLGALYTKEAHGNPGFLYGGSGNPENEQFGVAVVSRFDSNYLAFNAPYSIGSDSVYVKQRTASSFNNVCSVSVPMADLSEFASQSLAHLNTVFHAFVGAANGGVAFATYRSEATTGGSVGLFGAPTGLAQQCTALKQVNNCALDVGQKQGQAIAGGPTCVGSSGRKLLIVGAPGYSNNAGRVDVYEEGTEFGSAVLCGAPTNTPTATPTANSTATPTPTVSATSTPKAMPIVEPTPAIVPGFDGSVIPADPKTSALPAPRVSLAGSRTMIIEAAMMTTKDKRFPFIGWLFSITSRSAKSRSSSSMLVEMLRASTKKRQLFSKRNRVSLRNLKPGTYTITYQPVFRRASSKNKSTRVLGRQSSLATFTIR